VKKLNTYMIFSLALLCAVCILLSPISAEAFAPNSGVNSRVRDKYDHLSESDEARIHRAVVDAEDSVATAFLVAVYDLDKTIPSGEDILETFGFDHRHDNVVLLVIKYSSEPGDYKHKYEMFTYGTPHKAISNREANEILDSEDVYNNLKSGDFADGAVAFIRSSVRAIESEDTDSEMDLIIGIGFGSFALIGVVAAVVAKFIPHKDINTVNSIHAKGKGSHRSKSSYGSRKYGGYGGHGGGFGGSSGGSRGGR
jgi:hypothetical protein